MHGHLKKKEQLIHIYNYKRDCCGLVQISAFKPALYMINEFRDHEFCFVFSHSLISA